MMKQYQQDLTGHILTLQIQTHIDATSHPIATSDSENSADEMIPAIPPQQKCKLFNKLTVKIEANVTDHTLGYVNNLW